MAKQLRVLKGDKGRKGTHHSSQSVSGQTALLHFSASDTGIGIAPDKLDEIFELFQQVHETSFHIEGTGLGLAISQQIMRMMGSSIHVTSTLGKDSAFEFQLGNFP